MKRKIPGTESAGDVTETRGLYHEFITQKEGAVAEAAFSQINCDSNGIWIES